MISRFFIERPIFANVLGIVVILLGVVCLTSLPVAQYPDIVPPTIQVSTYYPGGNASVVANTVGIPIEQAVNGVEGSIYMSSVSTSQGNYTLTITFAVGTDLNTSLALVQNFVNGALSQLPPSVYAQGVTVRKVNTDILNVVSLYSDDDRYDQTFLTNYAAINMQYPLARRPGVGQVGIMGAGQYSMRIWLDPTKLQSYGLTVMDVQNAVSQQNVQVAAGMIGAPPCAPDQAFQFTVNTLGRLSEVSQFEDIMVKGTVGQAASIVRIRDIARVELSQQMYSNFAGVSGHKSAQIIVYALPGANALNVANEIKIAVKKMSEDFPDGMKYAILYDTTKFVRSAIKDVYVTLFEAGILVLIVILVFLQNFRAMLIPATTVPITIIGAFIAMSFLGFSINLMTLFALILAIGIVVDDAIIVVENTSHYIEKGVPPKEATIRAMKELTGPIMGITLVLTAVFLPAAFLPGISGQLFRQFALVIAATAVISALNALTLNPAQCALYLRPPSGKKPNAFYRGFNRCYEMVERAYMGVVRRMVTRARLTVVVFFVIIGLAGYWFTKQPVGFLPDEDQGFCILVVKLPDAAAQPRVEAVCKKVNAILEHVPGVDGWVTMGGYSVLDTANATNMATIFIIYESWEKRGKKLDQQHIVAELRRSMASIEEAGIGVLIPPPIRGLGQAGGFQMMVEDRGGVGLQELAGATRNLIKAANVQPGLAGIVTTFSAQSPQIFLDIDRVKAETLQVSFNDVFQTIQTYLGSSYVNLFNIYNQVFQVYLQADARYRSKVDDLQYLYVKNISGQMVPVGTLVEVTSMAGTELLTRYQMYPAVPVIGGSAPGYSSGQALNLMEKVADQNLPKGVSSEWTATAYQEKQVGNTAYFIYALSIILVYLVLAAQYESWSNPAAVILVVPMALVGVLLALVIRGYDNNLYTQVGLVLMIALASKNAILVVEFARELRASGMSIAEAAVEATRRRFRPIAMTSFAFILGVVPLLSADKAGAASQRAIGTVVFGGMLASTLLAIPFVPVFYVILQGWSERRGGPKTQPILPKAAANGAEGEKA